jgi:hypothetical protein
MVDADKVLSPERAAALLYNTQAPTATQVTKVREKIARNVLGRSSRGGWTTTPGAIAKYLADKAAAKAARPSRQPAAARRGAKLPGFYRELMKDYLLALVMRRTTRKRSWVFLYAVSAMQVVLVLAPIVATIATWRSVAAARTISPARAAVERWLADEYEEHQIHELTEVSEGAVRARFWYRQGGSKRIESDRLFTIEGDRVAGVEMPQ